MKQLHHILWMLLLCAGMASSQDWGDDPVIPQTDCFIRSEQIAVWPEAIKLEWRIPRSNYSPTGVGVFIWMKFAPADRNWMLVSEFKGKRRDQTFAVTRSLHRMKTWKPLSLDGIGVLVPDTESGYTLHLESRLTGERESIDLSQWKETYQRFVDCIDKHWTDFLKTTEPMEKKR